MPFLVVLFGVVLMAEFWWLVVAVLVFAIVARIWWRVGVESDAAATAQALADFDWAWDADEQNELVLARDLRGVHGHWPPADLSRITPPDMG